MGVRRLEGEEPLMSHWRRAQSQTPATQAPVRAALHLVVASGYLNRLLSNPAIERHLTNRHPELVDEFRAIIAASSLDELLGARRRREVRLTGKGSEFAGKPLVGIIWVFGSFQDRLRKLR